MKKLSSLTIFFPFLNDEGTVERQISFAYNIGKKVAREIEVIALHGGQSLDNTMGMILQMKEKYPNLKVIDKFDNKEGYAVIKHGFRAAKKEWVFYTDGDAQYHLEKNLPKLVEKHFLSGADVVNGYKLRRRDTYLRVILGNAYAYLSRKLLKLPIRDVDCDFRLIRGSLLRRITLKSSSSSILPELIKKLQMEGARFAEIPVAHYPRIWGTSNYDILALAREKLVGDMRLYFEMKDQYD